MTEQQQRLLDILEWFHSFCVENGLRYYMIAGTLLGAIRHGGFIPWDDDIDVGMPRRDYERLREIASTQKKTNICLSIPGKKTRNIRFFGRNSLTRQQLSLKLREIV